MKVNKKELDKYVILRIGDKERLTVFRKDTNRYEIKNRFITLEEAQICVNKLAEYENTNLNPQEVEQLKSSQNKLAVEKLIELATSLNKLVTGKMDKYESGIYRAYKKLLGKIAELKGEKQ